jgi:hypothetical protein
MIHKQFDPNLSEAEQALAVDLMTDFSAAYGNRAALRRRLLSAYGDERGWWSATGEETMLNNPRSITRRLALAGFTTFVLTLIALIVGAAVLAPRWMVGSAVQEPGSDGVASSGQEASAEGVQAWSGSSGSPLDASTFPEYVLATGSEDAGGPAMPDYHDFAADDNTLDPCGIYLVSDGLRMADFTAWDQTNLCFNVPIPEDELRTDGNPQDENGWAIESVIFEMVDFTLYLTSPGGQQYSQRGAQGYIGLDGQMLHDLDDPVMPEFENTLHGFPVYFLAAQPYGDWQVELKYSGGTARGNEIPIASGTIHVTAQEPIYSITPVTEMPSPFQKPRYGLYQPGETLVFAGRGWQPSQTMSLVLYAVDATRSDAINTVMIPLYAIQVVTSSDGTFYAQFEIDSNMPPGNYRIAFDPQPGIFEPGELGFSVVQP